MTADNYVVAEKQKRKIFLKNVITLIKQITKAKSPMLRMMPEIQLRKTDQEPPVVKVGGGGGLVWHGVAFCSLICAVPLTTFTHYSVRTLRLWRKPMVLLYH